MKKPDNKKSGQLNLSFGMIFSIILIVAFIAFAVYAIIKFLGFRESVEIGNFKKTLQDDIDDVWRSSQTSQAKEYALPKEIKYACFIDFSSSKTGRYQDFYSEFRKVNYGSENFVFYPIESAPSGLESFEIKNINLDKITETENPYCLANTNGKVKLKMQKNFNEALVTISK